MILWSNLLHKLNVFCLLILTTIRHNNLHVRFIVAHNAGVCILRVKRENRNVKEFYYCAVVSAFLLNALNKAKHVICLSLRGLRIFCFILDLIPPMSYPASPPRTVNNSASPTGRLSSSKVWVVEDSRFSVSVNRPLHYQQGIFSNLCL